MRRLLKFEEVATNQNSRDSEPLPFETYDDLSSNNFDVQKKDNENKAFAFFCGFLNGESQVTNWELN